MYVYVYVYVYVRAYRELAIYTRFHHLISIAMIRVCFIKGEDDIIEVDTRIPLPLRKDEYARHSTPS